jgi:hypothetical protein
MDLRRLQGWALVLSAVPGLVSLVDPGAPILRVLLLIGAVLLILGVPAIQSVQPTGAVGLIGIILIEVGVIIALVLLLVGAGTGSGIGSAAPLASALAGGLGRVIVGWLTTREKLFASWIGWAFLVEGIVNFLGGQDFARAMGSTIGIVVILVGTVALVGYGLGIARRVS